MKVKELLSMSEVDLENKSLELKKELMKINSQIAIGTVPKNPGKVKEIKRTIAKILTVKMDKNSSKKEEVKRNG
ncbi:50S ribosomal protein L29 [Candidatus Woesearchaeota archaeon]|nr:50S ribosomal protein L29 [Candidatus Woesearchaeota archaeon]